MRRPSGIRFSDIAVQAKLDFKHLSGSLEKKYLPETFSGGVAWIDYNQDGWPDLYLVNGSRWEELLAGKRTVSNALFQEQSRRHFHECDPAGRSRRELLGHGQLL